MSQSLLHPTTREPIRYASVRRLSLGLCLTALICLAGCSGKKDAKATVSGKVTLGGKAVTVGEVVFIGEDGKETPGPIHPETGAYSVTPQVGKNKILVKPGLGGLSMGGAGGGGANMPVIKEAPTSSGPKVSAPAKYAKPDNGLTYDVKEGKQTYDIELQP